jgi:hypothetical protein
VACSSLALADEGHKADITEYLSAQGHQVVNVSLNENSVRNKAATLADTAGPELFGGETKVFHYRVTVQLQEGEPIVCDRISVFADNKSLKTKRVQVSGCSF